ncbi:hypothetical protein [Polymorphospora rubra]|uniref:Uncharacterized protein n=1 Tax=Polymorphospora rubra TaxID=338584 RepID=A0A810MUB0_9ACTN|nr:hypothetical protein [Polymorphospora rubra]BCJ64100.1 hypothetical protein Prubr_11210 [Polymorphospora rubra]
MATYAFVRGWLQIAFEQRTTAEKIIDRNRHPLYSGGWAFPSAPFNWTLYLFYGGDIRQPELPWLREQIAEMAAMPPIDDDGDRPTGLFLVTDEQGRADTWQIRNGALNERPAPDLSWLDE